MVDSGLGLNRVGEGERFAEPFRGGGRNPLLSGASLSLPLVARSPSPTPIEITVSSLTGTAFAGSPNPELVYAGLGERVLGVGGFGLDLAICSKCERREDTGCYIS
jgi:hypothetical protein